MWAFCRSLVAIYPFEVLMWVIWTAFGGLSVFGPLVVLGCYWERATRERGAIAGAIVGVAAVLLFFFTGWYNTLHLAVVAFIFSMLAMVGVSLLTPAACAHPGAGEVACEGLRRLGMVAGHSSRWCTAPMQPRTPIARYRQCAPGMSVGCGFF